MQQTDMITDFLFEYPPCVLKLIFSQSCPDDCECFRITRHNPAIFEDFEPQRFSQPHRNFKGPKTDFYGISMQTSKDLAENFLLKMPNLGKYIHSGVIVPSRHGHLLNCDSSATHKDWYPAKGIQPEKVISKHEYTCP